MTKLNEDNCLGVNCLGGLGQLSWGLTPKNKNIQISKIGL